MEDIRSIHLRLLQTRLGDIAYQLARVRAPAFCPQETWCPAINAYRCREGILICAELAGVDKARIELGVEPGRLWLRGQRLPPEPRDSEGPPLQVLAMEIDYGVFEREIVLPAEVAPEQVRAEQREGVLWIWLPLAERS